MIKRVRVSQLRLGMYVHDLHSSWLKHPFFHNSFILDNPRKLKRILESGITELDIDTEKGLDIDFLLLDSEPEAGKAESEAELQSPAEERLGPVSSNQPLRHGLRHLPRVTAGEELHRARDIQREANLVMHKILTDVRSGNQINQEEVEGVVQKVTDSIFRNQDALLSLTRIKQKDKYTFQHSVSVCALLISFCREMGYDRGSIEQAGVGGLLHDIGKMRIPDQILNKPGPLSHDEFEIMKTHVTVARDILKPMPGIPQSAIEVVEQHHERYDGSGYPQGLRGDEISTLGLMTSIVDVYDAMTAERVYKKAMDVNVVLRKIYELRSSHFNSELALRFIRIIGVYPVGTLVRLRSGYLAVVVEQHHQDLLHPRVRIIMNLKRQCMEPQRDVDLSKPAPPGEQDAIVGPEPPGRWKIDPLAFML